MPPGDTGHARAELALVACSCSRTGSRSDVVRRSVTGAVVAGHLVAVRARVVAGPYRPLSPWRRVPRAVTAASPPRRSCAPGADDVPCPRGGVALPRGRVRSHSCRFAARGAVLAGLGACWQSRRVAPRAAAMRSRLVVPRGRLATWHRPVTHRRPRPAHPARRARRAVGTPGASVLGRRAGRRGAGAARGGWLSRPDARRFHRVDRGSLVERRHRLGLAIVDAIARAHGGSASVASTARPGFDLLAHPPRPAPTSCDLPTSAPAGCSCEAWAAAQVERPRAREPGLWTGAGNVRRTAYGWGVQDSGARAPGGRVVEVVWWDGCSPSTASPTSPTASSTRSAAR